MADTTFENRSRGQVMADTLVERVTGRPAGQAEPVAVNLVLSDETLLGGDNSPALIGGYGPIPAAVARALVHESVTDERAKATLRRLYRHPHTGADDEPRLKESVDAAIEYANERLRALLR